MWLLTPALLSGQIEYIYVNDFKLGSFPSFYELKMCFDARGVVMSVINPMHIQIAILQVSNCPPNVGEMKWWVEIEVEGEECSVIPSRLTVIPVWLVI